MIFSERDPVVWAPAERLHQFPHPCPVREQRPDHRSGRRHGEFKGGSEGTA